jgi:hypothetical protein
MSDMLIIGIAVIDAEKEPDWQAAESAIEGLTPATVSEFGEEALERLMLDWSSSWGASDAKYLVSAEAVDGLKRELRSDLDYFRQAVAGETSDCVQTKVRGAKVWVMGGSTLGSSGETPTNIVDVFERLCDAGIYAAAGFEAGSQ